MEHRWGLRKQIDRAVHLWTTGGVGSPGQLRDISISGAFVVTSLPVQLFAHVQIQIKPLRGEHRTTETIQGQVVRREPDGFAVEWCKFAPRLIRA